MISVCKYVCSITFFTYSEKVFMRKVGQWPANASAISVQHQRSASAELSKRGLSQVGKEYIIIL